MTSARKIRANRANAKASTGPRTTRGKSKAAQNARRHGLSLSINADPACAAQVKNFAREIAGKRASPEIFEPAHCFAEAEIDLIRIRQARRELFSVYLPSDRNEHPQDRAKAGERICGQIVRSHRTAHFDRPLRTTSTLPPKICNSRTRCCASVIRSALARTVGIPVDQRS